MASKEILVSEIPNDLIMKCPMDKEPRTVKAELEETIARDNNSVCFYTTLS